MVFSSVGSRARAPMAVVGMWSVRGVQVVPPSVVRQTPPSAPEMKYVSGLVGLATTAEMRPAQPPDQLRGAGPRSVQSCAVAVVAVVAEWRRAAVIRRL